MRVGLGKAMPRADRRSVCHVLHEQWGNARLDLSKTKVSPQISGPEGVHFDRARLQFSLFCSLDPKQRITKQPSIQFSKGWISPRDPFFLHDQCMKLNFDGVFLEGPIGLKK